MIRLTILAAGLIGATAAVAQDSPSKTDPQVAFNNHCRQCHSTKEGDNRLGPSLYQVVGRKAGTAEGYRYSSALEQADWTWDEEMLDQWITNPDSVASGNKMKPYPGLEDEAQRAAIIEHLRATGTSGGSGGESGGGSDSAS